MAVKKILVPADLPGNNEATLTYASELAASAGAGVYLFHAAPLPEFYVSELDDYAKFEKEFKAVIKRIHSAALTKLQEIGKQYFGASQKVICRAVLAKNVYNEILDYGETVKPDLIIMGGGEGSSRIRIGANTERILRLTKIPVLVVRNKARVKARKIVFASDFRKNSVEVFGRIAGFIEDGRTQVRLLYINTKSEFEEYDAVKERIEKFKKNFQYDFSVVIRAGKSVESSIVKYAESIDADLIAMGIKRKKRLPLYFTDRITEGVINISGIPVLAVNS